MTSLQVSSNDRHRSAAEAAAYEAARYGRPDWTEIGSIRHHTPAARRGGCITAQLAIDEESSLLPETRTSLHREMGFFLGGKLSVS